MDKLNSISERNHLMQRSSLSLTFSRIFAVSLATLFIVPLSVVAATAASPGGGDFEIPISELNKVKKKTPANHATGEARESKKKKREAKKKAATSGSVKETVAATGEATAGAESFKIHHSPYSFVVAGKPTVIYAVVSSKIDVKEINCTLRTTGEADKNMVKMVKMDGTRFTYTATLPGVAAGSTSLRYTIDTVDTQGNVTSSKEFATPVVASPIVPSWQLDNTATTPTTQEEVKKEVKEEIKDVKKETKEEVNKDVKEETKEEVKKPRKKVAEPAVAR
jgi:hypothetical protein